MRNKEKIVLPVTEPTPTEQPSIVPEASETARQQTNGKSGSSSETVVQPKPLTTQERLDYIEKQFVEIDKNFQQIGAFLGKMEPLVKLSDQLAQQQASGATAPAQGAAPNILSLLAQFAPMLTGGGGQDSEMAALGKDALRSQINMSKAITDAVISKITGKAVIEVAEAVAGA